MGTARRRHPVLRSNEELHHFRIFTKHFADDPAVIGPVGQWPHM
jgi:hypothetical protein